MVLIDVRCLIYFNLSNLKSLPGENVGFLFCINLEHSGLAYAIQLLCQDCECNCSEVSEETAGKGACFVDKEVVKHYTAA